MAACYLSIRVPDLIDAMVIHLDDLHGGVISSLDWDRLVELWFIGPVGGLSVRTDYVYCSSAIVFDGDLIELWRRTWELRS